ncbi:MAG: dihydroorotase [Pseudomonadota bacterium]
MELWIRNGRLIDPAEGRDGAFDLWISDGSVRAILRPGECLGRVDREIDATGAVITPGFVDLHVHFREPGQTDKEDIESGSLSAVAGGFTSVLCMANTTPVNDSPEITSRILDRARQVDLCRVYPVGAVTCGLEGKESAPLAELRQAGCVAFSDDGRPCHNTHLLRRALAESKRSGLLIIEHCDDPNEVAGLSRALTIAAETGGRLHIAHVSCRESVDLISRFRKHLPTLTSEVTPHHLVLTSLAIDTHGTNAKMNPPLRTEEDCAVLRTALAAGMIDAVATDHAPHTPQEKGRPFPEAPNGVIGLETALPVLLSLVHRGELTLVRMVEALSTTPARIAGLRAGSLAPGMPADLAIFEADGERELHGGPYRSKSRNTPFAGFKGRGRMLYTFVGGRQVFGEER